MTVVMLMNDNNRINEIMKMTTAVMIKNQLQLLYDDKNDLNDTISDNNNSGIQNIVIKTPITIIIKIIIMMLNKQNDNNNNHKDVGSKIFFFFFGHKQWQMKEVLDISVLVLMTKHLILVEGSLSRKGQCKVQSNLMEIRTGNASTKYVIHSCNTYILRYYTFNKRLPYQ